MSLLKYPKDRIAILDGFRCLCIIAVMLFHYFVAYTPQVTGMDFYPYHDKYSHFYLFQHGQLGVQCFFVISGFAIFMTLEKTDNIQQFIIQRFIRLWPTLLICSIVSFVFLNLFPFSGLRPGFDAFLPSLTITQPYAWVRLFNLNTYFIDGVEWSLVVEVSFYATSSILYFLNEGQFFRNWLFFVAMLLGIHFLAEKFNWIDVNRWLNFTIFPLLIVYFTVGMYLYMLYEKRNIKLYQHLMAIILTAVQLMFLQTLAEDIIIVVFLSLFLLAIYAPQLISVLGNRIFAQVGFYSYTIYLIHNWIGVILINKFAVLFSTVFPLPIVALAVLVIAVLTIVIEALSSIFKGLLVKKLLLKFQRTK